MSDDSNESKFFSVSWKVVAVLPFVLILLFVPVDTWSGWLGSTMDILFGPR